MKSWKDKHVGRAPLLDQRGDMREDCGSSREQVVNLSVAQERVDRMARIQGELGSNCILVELAKPLDERLRETLGLGQAREQLLVATLEQRRRERAIVVAKKRTGSGLRPRTTSNLGQPTAA